MATRTALTVGGVSFVVAAIVAAVATVAWTASEAGLGSEDALVVGAATVAGSAGLLGGVVGGRLGRRRLGPRSGFGAAALGGGAHGALQGLFALGAGTPVLGLAVVLTGGIGAACGAALGALVGGGEQGRRRAAVLPRS